MHVLKSNFEQLKKYGKGDEITTRDIIRFEEDYPKAKGILNEVRHGALPRIKKGRYSLSGSKLNLSVEADTKPQAPVAAVTPEASNDATGQKFPVHIPKVNPTFVPFGIHSDLKKVIQSKEFAPVYITGDSGNGKTLTVEQICAKLKIPFDEISIDAETNYDHLICKVGLRDGNTIIEYGAVARAMLTGSVLLLDEIDRGMAKNLMCIQAVLNGDPLIIKETGETIYPKPGFNIIATGNTKGQGDETDRFISADCLDEAFLERFPITLEQSYPTKNVEIRILLANGMTEEDATLMVDWAHKTRESYENNATDNFITTRRLCSIAKNYKIYGNLLKATKVGCARFADSLRDSFVELFKSMAPHYEDNNKDGEDDEG